MLTSCFVVGFLGENETVFRKEERVYKMASAAEERMFGLTYPMLANLHQSNNTVAVWAGLPKLLGFLPCRG